MTDKNNTDLSCCVDKVLDHVGASEQIRRNQVEKGMVDEVVRNLTCLLLHCENVRWHNFGSWCEGTTTHGLASDIDCVFYAKVFPAVEKILGGLELCCLIINEGTTKPGYVKLQFVRNGIPAFNIATPITDTDQFGRACMSARKNIFDRPSTSSTFLREERTGPALTTFDPVNLLSVDSVFAFRCYSIPSFTRGWIHRPRKYGWPSQKQLNNMSTYGCFLVGKGHPSSQTEHLEWRISFSLQERELMLTLNMTQHKCYILLKMIKQYLVSKMNVKSISSYHLKTSLFYTIENNPAHIWIPDNILYCTELCLKQVLDWLNSENCPNFFVPEENMFDRLSSDVMKMTAKYIRDMLDSDGQYLMLLTCDKIGELLQESLSGKVLSNLSRDAIELDLNSRLYVIHLPIAWTNEYVTSKSRNCAPETLSALQFLLEEIRNVADILTSEKVFREIQKGVNLLLPNIHLQIAKTIAAMMLNVTDTDKNRELMHDFHHHIELAKDVDKMSQKLIQASLMYKENKLEECERILADCETSLKGCILTACSCTDTYWGNEIETLLEKGDTASLSLLELRKYVTPCLMFLPPQADLAPTPLHYEMYRSVGADTDTAHPDLHYWYGYITIDANVYLFFLQYIVYSKLNKHDFAAKSKSKLALFVILTPIVTDRPRIGHGDTCLNLLAWIFKHENNIERAIQCFYMSWKMRPDHNAAKWHMLVMMYDQYIQRSKR